MPSYSALGGVLKSCRSSKRDHLSRHLWRAIDVPDALLSREPKSSERRLHLNKLKMPPQGRCCQGSRSCLSNTKTCQNSPPCRSSRHPPVNVIFLPRVVSVDMRDEHQIQAWSSSGTESLASEIFAELGCPHNYDDRSTKCHEALEITGISLLTSLCHDTGTGTGAVKTCPRITLGSRATVGPWTSQQAFDNTQRQMSSLARDARYETPRSWIG